MSQKKFYTRIRLLLHLQLQRIQCLIIYASFCKVLSVSQIDHNIRQLLLQQSIPSQNIIEYEIVVKQEIYKLLMSQMTSIKYLSVFGARNVIFTTYPEAKDCLKNLSELDCGSNACSDFFIYYLRYATTYKYLV